LFDTDNFHDNSTNPTRVTVPAGLAGKYLLTGVCEWSPVSTGEVISYFRKNGTGTAYALMRHTGATGVDYDYSFSYVLDLAAGDYVELIVQQGQGSSVNLQTRSGGSPALIMMRLDSGSVDVLRAHGCRVNRTTGSVSVGNNTYTVIGYDAEKYDTDSMHDTGSNTSRIVIPAIAGVTTGLWSFKMSGYTDASSGRVDAMFRKNSAGSSVGGSIIGFTIQAASATGLSGYLAYGNEVLSAGDYIETFVRTSAASGNVLYDSDAGPVFEVAFLGKVT
jgi:hypothetical protein